MKNLIKAIEAAGWSKTAHRHTHSIALSALGRKESFHLMSLKQLGRRKKGVWIFEGKVTLSRRIGISEIACNRWHGKEGQSGDDSPSRQQGGCLALDAPTQ
eukprot:scaffold2207_cov161-Ochromonas_danica.AAC.2